MCYDDDVKQCMQKNVFSEKNETIQAHRDREPQSPTMI